MHTASRINTASIKCPHLSIMCPSYWFLSSCCMFCLAVWFLQPSHFIYLLLLLHNVSIPLSSLHLGQWWWSLTGLILFPLCVCLKSVRDSSSCKRREEQECFRLANCRSCSLNANCQWELQQQECQALPGEETCTQTQHFLFSFSSDISWTHGFK